MSKFRLKNKQIEKMADIIADLGLIAVASVVLPAVFDRFRLLQISSGIVVASLCWLSSLWLLTSVRENNA